MMRDQRRLGSALVTAALAAAAACNTPRDAARADSAAGGVRDVAFDQQFFTNPLWEALRDRPNGFASVAAL